MVPLAPCEVFSPEAFNSSSRMKIGVLTEFQPESAIPKVFVSKNSAALMCRRLTHERLSRGLIRALKLRAAHACDVVPRAYIPVKMPPREVPGCWFQLPQSDQWKIDHRTVSFLA